MDLSGCDVSRHRLPRKAKGGVPKPERDCAFGVPRAWDAGPGLKIGCLLYVHHQIDARSFSPKKKKNKKNYRDIATAVGTFLCVFLFACHTRQDWVGDPGPADVVIEMERDRLR